VLVLLRKARCRRCAENGLQNNIGEEAVYGSSKEKTSRQAWQQHGRSRDGRGGGQKIVLS
jgi:hypothetical protein